MRIDNARILQSLKEAVRRKKLTQVEISKQIGINQSQVSRLLRGGFRRRSKSLYALCTFLGVSIVSTKASLSLSAYPDLSFCLSEILDGTRRRERAVVRLLRSARSLS